MTRDMADTLRWAGADRLTRSQRSQLLELMNVYEERNPGTRIPTVMVANWVTYLLHGRMFGEVGAAANPDRDTRDEVMAAADRVEAEGRPLMAAAMRKRGSTMATEAQRAEWRRRDRLDDAAVRRAAHQWESAAPPASADPFARTDPADPDIRRRIDDNLRLLNGDGDPLGLGVDG